MKLSKKDVQFVRDSLRLIAEQREQLEARREDCEKRLATPRTAHGSAAPHRCYANGVCLTADMCQFHAHQWVRG